MTKELEQAARRYLDAPAEPHIAKEADGGDPEKVREMLLVGFALTQLRRQLADLERRGYAGHKEQCDIHQGIMVEDEHGEHWSSAKQPCTCGWDEMKRELEAR